MATFKPIFYLSLLQFVLLILPSAATRSLPVRSAGNGFSWLSHAKKLGKNEPEESGTIWAVLVAGSNGFWNYRHQADVCHAYQILKRGGLKDENIIVFMYDDIANDTSNPRPGIIINHPNGSDVYAGVPKDYTGDSATAENLYAVLLANRTGLKGGSGKVVDSTPNDRIFIYYTDHGGPGSLGMPSGPFLYANDLIRVLEEKHASGTYKEMVIYVEACESGSIFEGLLPENLNIYVTTASNANESSWATYCPDMKPPPPPEYDVCLGDLYSVSWMEDSDSHDSKSETLEQQYENVKLRTYNNHSSIGSHVMQYGTKGLSSEDLYLYQGSSNINSSKYISDFNGDVMEGVDQRDADLIFLQRKYGKLEDGSVEKAQVLTQIREITDHRSHLAGSIEKIGLLLFGPQKANSILNSVKNQGLPLTDDWGCLKATVRTFETHCGSLTQYGMKHMRAFANVCNNGITILAMEEASKEACKGYNLGQWNPAVRGSSA